MATTQTVRDALLSGRVSHTRYRVWVGQPTVFVYFRGNGPTGLSSTEWPLTLPEAEFNSLFDELTSAGLLSRSLSPLSPTEAR